MSASLFKNLVFPTDTVEIGGQNFTVHGLSMRDIADLSATHAGEVRTVLQGGGSSSGATIVNQLLRDSPVFVAKVIMIATRAPAEDLEHILLIPAGSQVLALKKIWDITAADPEVVELIKNALGSASEKGLATLQKEKAQTSQNNPQPRSSGAGTRVESRPNS